MAMRHGGLAKLAEEIGELGQVVGKRLQYPDGPHPDEHREKPLDERMEDEIADVVAACWFVVQKRGLDRGKIGARLLEKKALFAKWDMEPGDVVSKPFKIEGRWYFEGEYHTSEYPTEAAAWDAARNYDAAVRKRGL